MAKHSLRVLVGKMKVAAANGGDLASVEAQAFHYALQYREEGEVTVQRQVLDTTGKPYWKRHALFAALTEDTPND